MYPSSASPAALNVCDDLLEEHVGNITTCLRGSGICTQKLCFLASLEGGCYQFEGGLHIANIVPAS